MHDIKLSRIEEKIDRVSERLNSVDVTLAAQHVSLAEHVRRTNLLEKEIAPIKTHVAMVQGAVKAIGVASILIGMVTGMLKLAEMVIK